MFSLINKDDCKVMANSRFVKNAVFYKDMFAFFDAYEKLLAESKTNIPSFCLQKKKEYCLEGICLFMKLYASELGFESVRLSLDYLKVLYYTIAGYSTDSKSVDKSVIMLEFEEYKRASVKIVEDSKADIDTATINFRKKKEKFDKEQNRYAKNLVASRIYSALATVLIIVSVVFAMLPFSFYFLDKFTLTTAIVATAVIVVVGFGLGITFKVLDKKTETKAGDIAYVLQGIKKEKDLASDNLKNLTNKANKIVSEKYEYLHSFSNIINPNAMSFDLILEKANEYILKSYNVAYDVSKLFESQQKEVLEMVSKVTGLPATVESYNEIVNLYKEISNQDWLYFNNEVRFNFLKKFVEVSEKSHYWSMEIDGAVVSPFGIDIKKIAKEEIAYLKSEDDLFVASSIDKFLNTKYAKELNAFEVKTGVNAELLKTIKVDYINHFYNYETVKDYNNLFYDKKIVSGAKMTNDVLLENQKIPTYIYMKIKLLENNIGLGNSDSNAVKQIAEQINGVVSIVEEIDEKEKSEQTVVSEKQDVIYPTVICDSIEEVNDGIVKYIFGDKVVFGYRLFNAN